MAIVFEFHMSDNTKFDGTQEELEKSGRSIADVTHKIPLWDENDPVEAKLTEGDVQELLKHIP